MRRGERLAKAGEALGITVQPVARGRNGAFIPAEICWVVERSFAWLDLYRRLNTIVERTKEHLIAFIAIAFVSILARRLKRLVTEAVRV
jgi:hypothetical protein